MTLPLQLLQLPLLWQHHGQSQSSVKSYLWRAQYQRWCRYPHQRSRAPAPLAPSAPCRPRCGCMHVCGHVQMCTRLSYVWCSSRRGLRAPLRVRPRRRTRQGAAEGSHGAVPSSTGTICHQNCEKTSESEKNIASLSIGVRARFPNTEYIHELNVQLHYTKERRRISYEKKRVLSLVSLENLLISSLLEVTERRKNTLPLLTP